MGKIWLGVCLLWLAVAACTGPGVPGTPDCSHLHLAPTATRRYDPQLSQPPLLPGGGGDGRFYCATVTPTPTLAITRQLMATEVVNLSLDAADQDLLAVAVGDDQLAVAWHSQGEIYVALARGSNHFQVRPIDAGTDAALVFSPVNRLHLVYEREGQLFYRAADQGTHPADVASELVAAGTRPVVVLNQFHYAQIIYEAAGELVQAAHQMTGQWQIGQITTGRDVSLVGYGVDLALGYIVAYTGPDEAVELARWQTTPYGFFPVWLPLLTIPPVPGQERLGRVGLAYRESQVYAAWVSRQPYTGPAAGPGYEPPLFGPVNPLAPDQVANPHYLHSGLNAVQWQGATAPFAAGLSQSLSVSSSPVTVSAWGLGPGLQMGLDGRGGSQPHSPDVVWSVPLTSSHFVPVSVSAPALSGEVTLFLQATAATPGQTAVWDDVTLSGGSLTNGGFEGAFVAQSTLTVPAGWTAYAAESRQQSGQGRDRYQIYLTHSADNGQSWSPPTVVLENSDSTGQLSGAFGPAVTPFIGSETHDVALIYTSQDGDPPRGTTFMRFGRPFVTACTTTACTPGTPILPQAVGRPADTLYLMADPHSLSAQALLVWDGLQADVTHKDVYATYLVVRP